MARLVFTLALVCLAASCIAEDDYNRFNSSDFLSASIPWDDSQADQWLPVVTTCLRCDREPEVNRSHLRETVEAVMAAHPDTRLILFAETITGWYFDPAAPGAYVESVAEPRDGPTMAVVQSLARNHATHIAFGYAETAGGVIYNSLAVVNPEGEIIANHRKRHLGDFDIESGYAAGAEATTITIDGIEIGLLICNDHLNHTLANRYAAESIKVIIHPLGDQVPEDVPFNYSARAYNKWFIVANRYGDEAEYFYDGDFGIADPGGNLRVADSEPGFLYYNLGIYR